MNKSYFIFFYTFFLSSGWALQAQSTLPISAQFQEVTLDEALATLKRDYQLVFAYDYTLTQAITINEKFEKVPLKAVLEKLLSSTNIHFRFVDEKRIILYQSEEASSSSISQIGGIILDATTQQPLPFASILVNDSTGIATDKNGKFETHIPSEHDCELLIRYVGYQSKRISISAPSSQALTIALQPVRQEMEAITIVESPPPLTTDKTSNAIKLNATGLKQLPAFAGGTDLFRSIQLLPGISANDDLSTELRIRGGSGDENMIVLDGITLYKIDHFYGIFSAINPNTVDEINVYKNAFPAEYGGRTAGVVEMHSKTSDDEDWNGIFEVNALTANGQLNIPITNEMQLLLSGRSTLQNVADSKFLAFATQQDGPGGIFEEEDDFLNRANELAFQAPVFNFYDATAKWLWNIQPSTQLQATYFGSFDHFQLENVEEYQFFRNVQDSIKRIAYSYEEETTWQNRGFGVQLKHQWNHRLNTHLTLSQSNYQTESYIANRIDTDVALREDKENSTENLNQINGWNINWKNSFQISAQEQLNFGVNVIENKVEVGRIVDNKIDNNIQGSSSGVEAAIYAQHTKTFGEKWTSNLGLRSTHYNRTNQLYFSPRLQLSYQLSDEWLLKGAGSIYHQFLRESYFEDRYGRRQDFFILANDRRFPVAQSNQVMLGFNYFSEQFEIDVEFYHKNTNGVMEYAHLTPGFSDRDAPLTGAAYRIFEGEGYCRGIDVLLKKHFGAYQGWIAYTYSQNQNRFEEINNNEFYPSQDDSRNQFKLINVYQWKDFNFSATYVYSDGRPYLDVTELEFEDRREAKLRSQFERLPDYHRMDIGVDYTFPIAALRGKLGFSVFNAFNRTNVKYRQYVYSIPDDPRKPNKNVILGNELDLLDRTFNLSFSLEF